MKCIGDKCPYFKPNKGGSPFCDNGIIAIDIGNNCFLGSIIAKHEEKLNRMKETMTMIKTENIKA